jgi:uncharacterized membrane protein
MRATVLGLIFLAMTGMSAEASVDFCSKFNVPIFVGVAYNQGDDWISTGWQRVEPGQCLTDPFGLSVNVFYYRGETDWIRNGRRKTQWSWGNGGRRFSVTDKGFTFHHADGAIRGARLAGFTISIESTNGPISERVTFEADGVHTTQATIH